MARTTIPVDETTRDLVREAKGFEQTYDELLRDTFSE
jgi:hypothetical protein